jgi:hypothetical protein
VPTAAALALERGNELSLGLGFVLPFA